MRVLIKTALNPYSGYGNDGIGFALALLRAGIDAHIDPTYVSPPLPAAVAQLLTKRLDPPFDLLIHHTDPGQMGLTPEARSAAKLTVGWTMWEYTSFGNLRGRSTLRSRLSSYDVVLGYDTVTTAAFADARMIPAERLGVLQGGYWPEQWPAARRDWAGDRFSFCMVGALHQRKEPFIAINAFRELKEEHPEEFAGAELHLKSNSPGLHSAMQQWVPKLYVHYDVWPDHVLREFYADQHVLIAPSRGEGKNLPALEMLSTGGTVIATNWGGHTQWLSPAYAYPLDYTLAPESAATPGCLSARASKGHLKELMLHAYRNRDEAQRKGDLAAGLIPGMCGWDAVTERLFLRLSDLCGAGHLLHEFRRSREEAKATKGLPYA